MIRRMMMAGLKKVSTGGGALVQSIGVNFSQNENIANWNTLYNGLASISNLINSGNTGTGYSLDYIINDTVEPNFTPEDQGSQTDPFGRFPPSVLKYMCYKGGFAGNDNRNSITVKFTGSAAKNYRIKVAAVQSYTDANDATSIIINGTSYNLGGPNVANVVYPTTDIFYAVNLPANGLIDIKFLSNNSSSGGYACINAIIIEEYTP